MIAGKEMAAPAISVGEQLVTTSPVHGERSFRCIRIEPYVRRRDGISIQLAVWASTCMVCGAAFEVTTPSAVMPAKSHAFGRVTCKTHTLTPSEISRLRSASAAERPRVFEEIKRAKLAERFALETPR